MGVFSFFFAPKTTPSQTKGELPQRRRSTALSGSRSSSISSTYIREHYDSEYVSFPSPKFQVSSPTPHGTDEFVRAMSAEIGGSQRAVLRAGADIRRASRDALDRKRRRKSGDILAEERRRTSRALPIEELPIGEWFLDIEQQQTSTLRRWFGGSYSAKDADAAAPPPASAPPTRTSFGLVGVVVRNKSRQRRDHRRNHSHQRNVRSGLCMDELDSPGENAIPLVATLGPLAARLCSPSTESLVSPDHHLFDSEYRRGQNPWRSMQS
ncbi:hypothetical protein QBC46DRAFT_412338 [Diplogelasinospora grovesii]|uniref:Uncharacterized protein n=1 Tax=Diplogelasinospora grovesii TaxID=303347 RepID=A0AAN6MZ43_9PEZI|nr:hypothetical protein QBC46DRAFT_412338 [Diplogelasinospora grovesii]